MKKLYYSIILLGAALVLSPVSGFSQMRGHNVLGDYGLKSGTREMPGLSLVLPFYDYNASILTDCKNNSVANDLNINSIYTGLKLNWVMPYKVLGAYMGGSVTFPFAYNVMQSNNLNVSSRFAFMDIYVQPLNLGWHLRHADLTVGYGIFIPTGNYEWGASDNNGLGMWSNEVSAGTTIYFDNKKTWTISTLVSYEIHSRKRDACARAGEILSAEGGLGKMFNVRTGAIMPMTLNVGVCYYAQYKITKDYMPFAPILTHGVRDKVYGFGPELDIFMPCLRSTITARWLWEPYSTNRFKGNTYAITWTSNLASWSKR